MIWLMLGIGLVVGCALGIWGTRHFEVTSERAKALDAITTLIDARELVELRPPPTASISYAGNQQWDFVVICGGTDGTE
jgi:hypothetical protein